MLTIASPLIVTSHQRPLKANFNTTFFTAYNLQCQGVSSKHNPTCTRSTRPLNIVFLMSILSQMHIISKHGANVGTNDTDVLLTRSSDRLIACGITA